MYIENFTKSVVEASKRDAFSNNSPDLFAIAAKVACVVAAPFIALLTYLESFFIKEKTPSQTPSVTKPLLEQDATHNSKQTPAIEMPKATTAPLIASQKPSKRKRLSYQELRNLVVKKPQTWRNQAVSKKIHSYDLLRKASMNLNGLPEYVKRTLRCYHPAYERTLSI